MSDRVIAVKLVDNAPLGGVAVITTPLIDVRTARFLLHLRIRPSSASAGSPDFSINMAISDYATLPPVPTFAVAPQPNLDLYVKQILASWNTTYAGIRDWRVIPFATLAGTDMSNPPGKYVSFKFTGLGTNPGDLFLDAKLEYSEAL